jgi:hypothetical protein
MVNLAELLTELLQVSCKTWKPSASRRQILQQDKTNDELHTSSYRKPTFPTKPFHPTGACNVSPVEMCYDKAVQHNPFRLEGRNVHGKACHPSKSVYDTVRCLTRQTVKLKWSMTCGALHHPLKTFTSQAKTALPRLPGRIGLKHALL